MLSYCLKQRKRTECVPNSETFVITKNGRNAMRCICAECGITKFRFISKGEMQGSGFDELIVHGLAAGAKGLYSRSSLNGHSRKRTALLTAALFETPF